MGVGVGRIPMMEPAGGLGVAAAVAVGESAVAASISVGYGVDGVGGGAAPNRMARVYKVWR